MTLEIALDSEGEWDSSGGHWADLAFKAFAAAIAESAHPHIADVDAEVSLSLTDDETVRALNAQWRGKDKPTNVLSFPMLDDFDLPADGPPAMLGDIAMAYETCAREASEKALPLENHAGHLMVHGMLHLLGHDHQDDEMAEDMEAREVRALARIGIADPYFESAA
ncbi:rRNA maturation RNase YbeY [Sphingomicrobium marinum]|uniref:rRNA maturation RNase YbeY n=1 Tax=Sphingomicrobium marinum TaxID=1227950 RepID=UPI00223FC134|nr:rRNA maturation RNase YbeY [Sphingomicrobium marinum]